MAEQVLEGLRVADFTWAVAGPSVSRYLADHGATVVRVESRTRLDVVRIAPPFKGKETHIERSGYYAIFNTSKYSLSLNLNHPLAPRVTQRLLSWAEVVGENFAPGAMKKWGLDYESVSRIKPDIIYISSSNLGQTGPHASHIGYGSQLVSLAGFTYLTGWPDREPSTPFGAYTDIIAPRLGTAALFAALDYRRRTGQGAYLDLSQLEAALHFLSPLFLDYFAQGREAQRLGNRSVTAAPHNAYPCRGEDRWCVIVVETEEEWARFCSALGNPPWTREPQFATLKKRKENEAELDRKVEEWTSQRTPEEVMALLQKAGVAAGVVATTQDLFQDPQLRHRQFFQPLEHPELGCFSFHAHPFHLSQTPAQLHPCPLMGEHNEYILKELLGLTDEEYIELLVAGALE